MSKIVGKTVLVTGANRGIGRAFVVGLLQAGAAKVYATARNLDTLSDLASEGAGKVVPLQLDVTKLNQVEAAASNADVALVVNNAGIAAFQGLISAGSSDAARQEMEINYFGTLNVARAFAPVLARNGGGAIINLSSIAGQVNFPALGSYSASKAAVHSLTQGIRAELAAQRTQVLGVYPGPVDTDMAKDFPMDKTSPSDVVKSILGALEAGEDSVYPDPASVELHAGLLTDPVAVERQVGQMLPG